MKRKMCRILTALSLTIVLIFCFSTPCYALENLEEQTVDKYLSDYSDSVYEVYLFIRNEVAIPLIILSFAFCGFRLLGANFFGEGPNPVGQVTKQLITSLLVLVLLFALPPVIKYVRGLLEATAWKPATGAFLLPHIFGR